MDLDPLKFFILQFLKIVMKDLTKYDLCDDDLSPEEWVKKCSKIEGYHAKTPLFIQRKLIKTIFFS